MGAVRIEPGSELCSRVSEGGEILARAGTHEGSLFLEHSVTIVGEPGTVIDGRGRGAAVHVVGDDITVVLRGLVFRNGHSELGGGVRVDGVATVIVEGCTFAGNRSAQGGGAAGLGASAGTVRVDRCLFSPRDGLLLTGLAEVEILQCNIDGDVRIREGAEVLLRGGRVGGCVSIRGTTTRTPRVTVDGTVLASPIENDGELPGQLEASATPS